MGYSVYKMLDKLCEAYFEVNTDLFEIKIW